MASPYLPGGSDFLDSPHRWSPNTTTFQSFLGFHSKNCHDCEQWHVDLTLVAFICLNCLILGLGLKLRTTTLTHNKVLVTASIHSYANVWRSKICHKVDTSLISGKTREKKNLREEARKALHLAKKR